MDLQTRELVPVDDAFRVRPQVSRGRVTLAWTAPDLPATALYTVYRAHGRHDLACTWGPNAARCTLASRRITTTKGTAFEEVPPAARDYTYRVAVVASDGGTSASGSAVVISPPVHVRVAASP